MGEAGVRQKQQGMGAILLVTILVMGVAWMTVGALSKAAYGTSDRDARTGIALKNAKEALLGYIAQEAANTTACSGLTEDSSCA